VSDQARSASEEPRSYYGRPIIKEPVWTWEIPCYLFVGGLAGASTGLAWVAELQGNEELARRAWTLAFAGVSVSPVLLISDLGRPERFLNMLRLFKVTSPMSVGSWILSTLGPAAALSAANSTLGWLPRPAAIAKPVAAVLGLPLASYTGALLTDTAVPAWRQARVQLPFVFAGGAAASAGAAAMMATPSKHAGAARRLAVGGAVAEMGAALAMDRGLGDLAEPYHQGVSGRLAHASQAFTVAGAALVAARARRSRLAALVGGGALLAGAMLERWAVFKAGIASARDPKFTVRTQRSRMAQDEVPGASRRA
jgi:formate-dependent nitrite reductase membrane component NrfD